MSFAAKGYGKCDQPLPSARGGHAGARQFGRCNTPRSNLVVIDFYFDGTCMSMIDLLVYVRSSERYLRVPAICVHGSKVVIPPVVRGNMDAAVRALGGKAFLDLRDSGTDFVRECEFLSRMLIPVKRSFLRRRGSENVESPSLIAEPRAGRRSTYP
jgi:hypothetical protein